MALVRPFKRLKPRADLAHEIAILAVESLDKDSIDSIVKNNPYSFFKVTTPQLYTEVPDTEEGKRMLNKFSKECLCSMKNDNILIEDEQAGMYVYKQVMPSKSLTGLVACTAVDDYVNNYIKKHELTRSEKETDIAYHIDACNANTGTIYLMYRWEEEIENIINNTMKEIPEYNFTTEDGVIHMIWPIFDTEKLTKLCELFKKVGNFYIADGHHRTAAASIVRDARKAQNPDHNGDEEYNFFQSALFADKDLFVMDYNRVVKGLNGLTTEEFFDKISENFDIKKYNAKEPYKPCCKYEFGMYIENQWYKLTAKSHTYDKNHPVNCLDVVVLQNYLLDPILGIKDPRIDERLDFVAGVLGLHALEERVHEDMSVAFSIFPCSIKEIMDVADSGKVMPPKTTWFEPKIRSGLFIHELT